MKQNIVKWNLPSEEERAYFDKSLKADGDCLLWTRSSRREYGMLRWQGRRWGAHRLALVWASQGVEFADLLVLHSCKNKSCCAIGHLRWGTAFENASDRRKDGTQNFGVRIRNAKLTDDMAKFAFVKYHEGGWSTQQIALHLGVTNVCIARVLHGETWHRVTAKIVLKKVRTTHKGRLIRTRPLSENEVLKIWNFWHLSGKTQEAIQALMNVSAGTVRKILSRSTYANVTENLTEYRPRRSNKVYLLGKNKKSVAWPRLCAKDIVYIWKMTHSNTVQQNKLAFQFGVSRTTIGAIAKGLRWRALTGTLVCESQTVCLLCARDPLRSQKKA